MSDGTVIMVVTLVVMSLVTGCYAQVGTACRDASNLPGRCISIRQCPHLKLLLDIARNNDRPPSSIMQTLRQSICDPQRNGQLLVCCREDANPVSVTEPSIRDGGNPLPTKCGSRDITDRIIDGEDAPLLAWPWMVLLRGSVQNQPSSWFCGAVLIHASYVITAAHCFKSTINTRIEFARVGEHTISTNPDCEKGICSLPHQDITVDRIILHPQYEFPCKECNDIAILKLSRPAQIDGLHVIPICLPVDPVKDMGFSEQEFQGKHAWAAGWGSISRNPFRPRNPNKLQQVLLPIEDTSFCNELKRDYPDKQSTLCAGGEGKDTCKGDSGGPLVLSNRFGTKMFLVGITSLGPSICGTVNTQGLYTSIHHYIQWIIQTLRS